MRQWTPEERQRQRELIRHWRPWKKAGVKTPEGKAKSKMNALKHGAYSAETKATRYLLRECRDVIVLANQYIRALRQRERLEKAIALKNKGSHSAKKTKTAERINKPVSPVNAFSTDAILSCQRKLASSAIRDSMPAFVGMPREGKNTKTAERINKTEGAAPRHGPNRGSDYRAILGDYPIVSPPQMPWNLNRLVQKQEIRC